MHRIGKFTHIDCFAGPGGVSTGLRAAGFKTLAAVEKVESCATTFSANHPDVQMIQKDIRYVTKNDFKGITKGSVDLLTAGMPCETFSTAGSTSRSSYDHRQTLFKEAIRIAKYFCVPFILFENVPAITTKKVLKGSDKLIVELIREELNEAGYWNQKEIILNSADFGVPQLRKRYFLLASLSDLELSVPEGLFSEPFYRTVADAFDGLPRLKAGTKHRKFKPDLGDGDYAKLMRDKNFWKVQLPEENLDYHWAPNHRDYTIERFKLIKPGEGLKDLFDKLSEEKVRLLQQKRVLPKKWYIQRNRRLRKNKSSMTVTSHCLDELLHPLDHRSITIREAARLQSFPDFYDFAGGPIICPHMYETQDKYEQIGDAIPPLLAYAWGKKMQQIFGQAPKVENLPERSLLAAG